MPIKPEKQTSCTQRGKSEKAEFEYSIRKQWQDEFGYEVSFTWQPASEYFTGFWKILLDGEEVGEILRETNRRSVAQQS